MSVREFPKIEEIKGNDQIRGVTLKLAAISIRIA